VTAEEGSLAPRRVAIRALMIRATLSVSSL